MKKSFILKNIVLILCAVLILYVFSSCAAEGEYYSEHEHRSSESGINITNALSTYEELEAEVKNIISAMSEKRNITVKGYNGNLDEDLIKLHKEVTSEYPLGVYSVSTILFEQSSILSYVKIAVNVQYRVSKDDVDSIVAAENGYDIKKTLLSAFEEFDSKVVMQVRKNAGDAQSIYNDALLQWSNSDCAVGLKQITVNEYPQTEGDRILEVEIEYLDAKDACLEQAEEIKTKAAEIAEEIGAEQGEDISQRLAAIYTWLSENVEHDELSSRVISETGDTQPKTSQYTAYGALIEKRAAQSGITLAAKSLCSAMGIDSKIEKAYIDGAPYTYLSVNAEGKWISFYPSAQSADEIFVRPYEYQVMY